MKSEQDSMRKLPSKQEIVNFRRIIIRWFKSHKREYPWRDTEDPFKVLIAEMMLQRTKADQVVPVYKQFFLRFKTPSDVATAKMRILSQILYPLGLQWRIKQFKKVSQAILEYSGGRVPESRDEISTLPGVGDYVAGIVLSIAFNKQEWIVDSNVVRVFKRFFGISTSKEGRRDKHVVHLAKIYAACKGPRKANLALLDFAALVCTPKKPKHERCPVSHECYHFQEECKGSAYLESFRNRPSLVDRSKFNNLADNRK
jgi:A/G-specific adenine glycosylase